MCLRTNERTTDWQIRSRLNSNYAFIATGVIVALFFNSNSVNCVWLISFDFSSSSSLISFRLTAMIYFMRSCLRRPSLSSRCYKLNHRVQICSNRFTLAHRTRLLFNWIWYLSTAILSASFLILFRFVSSCFNLISSHYQSYIKSNILPESKVCVYFVCLLISTIHVAATVVLQKKEHRLPSSHSIAFRVSFLWF